MIKLGQEIVNFQKFPDGTTLLKINPEGGSHVITWLYENNEEMMNLYFLVKHLKSNGTKGIVLYMPYIPNARMDRVKGRDECFTLKYFAEFINSLEFEMVKVLDPHSSVSEALINNIDYVDVKSFIKNTVLNDVKPIPDFLFFPDEGSMKRYSKMFDIPFLYGMKNRDWKTGKILGLNVIGDFDIKRKSILIIDDICSRGGTFLFSAQKLKELGAGDIYLYISHCENTVLEGELINSGLLKKIYTTNSIFTKENELIEVVHKF